MSYNRLVYLPRYDRRLIRRNPDVLFVFGDNLTGTGYGGQAAAARDEPNAVGIPTKVSPSEFFTPEHFDVAKRSIDAALQRLRSHKGVIVWPSDNVGTGLAQLPERAPLIFAYIEAQRMRLECYCSSDQS